MCHVFWHMECLWQGMRACLKWSLCMKLFSLFRRRQWHPTPVLLPGKFHGWRSLVGCSPWGCKESDMTERLHFHFSLLCTGEGNGTPLQCSCLENPRDGVAQSQTRLKWLSSSSSSILPLQTLFSSRNGSSFAILVHGKASYLLHRGRVT